MPKLAKKHIRPLVTIVGGLMLWCSWAAWANHEHGAMHMERAVWTQFGLSLVFLLFMTSTVESIAKLSMSAFRRWVYAICGPAFAALILMLVVHQVRGTPNMWFTMAPSVFIGFSYCTIIMFWQSRIERRENAEI